MSSPFSLYLIKKSALTWGGKTRFHINNDTVALKKVAFDEKISCVHVKIVFEMETALGAEKMMNLPWYQLVARVMAVQDGSKVVGIQGGSCSQCLGLAMQFSNQPDNFMLCKQTNQIAVSIPFDFSGSSTWHLNLECENYFEVELMGNHDAKELAFKNVFVLMHCKIEKKNTRRVVLTSGPKCWQKFQNSTKILPFQEAINFRFTSSSNIRYIYFIVIDEKTGQVCTLPVNATMIVKNLENGIIYSEKFYSTNNAWSVALSDHEPTSNAVFKLSNLPTYVWTRTDVSKHLKQEGVDCLACSNQRLLHPDHSLEIKGCIDLPPNYDSDDEFSVQIQSFVAVDEIIEKNDKKILKTETIEAKNDELTLQQLHERVQRLEKKSANV